MTPIPPTERERPREYPILFSGAMVRALLVGTKSQTRRLDKRWMKVKAGDRLWVRETWCPGDRWMGCDCDPPCTIRYRADGYVRTFTGPGPGEWYAPNTKTWGEPKTWKPSICLPRWASRLTLTATADARAERLQDISEEDARAEGIIEWTNDKDGTRYYGLTRADVWETNARGTYKRLWNAINPEVPWSSNPEVVVLTFARLP